MILYCGGETISIIKYFEIKFKRLFILDNETKKKIYEWHDD